MVWGREALQVGTLFGERALLIVSNLRHQSQHLHAIWLGKNTT